MLNKITKSILLTLLITPLMASGATYKIIEQKVVDLKGAGDWVEAEPAYTAWSNVDGTKSCDVWTPQIDKQLNNFEQTRGCFVDQTREKTTREYNTELDTYRDLKTTEETRFDHELSEDETRQIVVSAPSWNDVNSLYNCDTWTPSTDTVFEDETFEQTRNCDQEQQRTITYETTEGTTLDTWDATQVVTVEQSQNNISGTKPLWVAISDNVIEGDLVGSKMNTTDWTPEATNQTSDFTQQRNYDQNREITTEEREQNQRTDEIRVVDTTITQQLEQDLTESRTVNVSVSSWSDVGEPYNCSNWTPDPSTKPDGQEFTQTSDDCTQDEERTWIYTADGTTVHSRVEPNSYTTSDEQQAIGTKDGTCYYDVQTYTQTWIVGVADGFEGDYELVDTVGNVFEDNPRTVTVPEKPTKDNPVSINGTEIYIGDFKMDNFHGHPVYEFCHF